MSDTFSMFLHSANLGSEKLVGSWLGGPRSIVTYITQRHAEGQFRFADSSCAARRTQSEFEFGQGSPDAKDNVRMEAGNTDHVWGLKYLFNW
jgi:hypothetical protein